MEKNKLPYHKSKNFKVPEGYFETLEERIMGAVTSNEEQTYLPKKEEAGFKVPENYFQNFDARLLDRIEKEKKPPKVINLLNKEAFYYYAGAAAVIIALITTVFTNPAQPVGFEDLDMLTLERYLHETFESSHSDIQYLSEEEAYLAPSGEADVDFDAVYEYLNENMEEPSLLFNEN